jgi:hypothetical protein
MLNEGKLQNIIWELCTLYVKFYISPYPWQQIDEVRELRLEEGDSLSGT